ncbi:hypothetical protein [Flavobacterium sp. DSR3-2]|uniref:hypothetical protein n=1 Tax=Flavobacterium sp. DSR3-2 TaxID=2804634 RepID=UPI003CE7DA0B
MKYALIGGRNWQYFSEVLVLREEIANGFIYGVQRFISATKKLEMEYGKKATYFFQAILAYGPRNKFFFYQEGNLQTQFLMVF